MTIPTPPTSPTRTRTRPRWPWLVLAIGLAWTAIIRVPLILHAADHIDSDLAVDGLTLIDALEGDWRWHYPGTPHMGTPPVLLSYFQALIWGPGPVALVSGGTVAWLLVVSATFLLAWRAFGPGVASWAIVPLVVSSTGTVWLSGRITGGHLLTLFWHASAFLGMLICLTKGGAWRSALLGLWCGLGLYLDTMFVFTLAGLVPAAVVSWWTRGRSKAGMIAALMFVVGLAIGAAPKEIGRRVDPYDPYNEQFAPVFRRDVLEDHAVILGLECLPRLIAGHELPDLQSTPEALTRNGRPSRLPPDGGGADPFAVLATLLSMGLFAASVARLVSHSEAPESPGRAVLRGTGISAMLIVGAFLVNRNIFNSDNYRYLIFLLVPWALGFGLLMASIARRGVLGRLSAVVLTLALAATMTGSIASWYVGLGWLGEGRSPEPGGPVTVTALKRDPGGRSTYVRTEIPLPAAATHVFGDYWDVYRAAFLSGGRVVGVPYPTYPNRFEGWSERLRPGNGALLILDQTVGWQAMLAEMWRREGRDPAELERISYLFP